MADDPDQIDDVDNPELSDADFAKGRPFAEVFPEAHAAWKRDRGRPRVERPKVKVGWRLAADVVDAVKATGKGYNARVERILREAIVRGEL